MWLLASGEGKGEGIGNREQGSGNGERCNGGTGDGERWTERHSFGARGSCLRTNQNVPPTERPKESHICRDEAATDMGHPHLFVDEWVWVSGWSYEEFVMSDTSSRNPSWAGQMLADALLRTVAGATATFRMAGTNSNSDQTQLGLVATNFVEAAVSPVVMRKLRPDWKEGGQSRWELLVSATGVQSAVDTLDLPSTESLFSLSVAVTVAGQDYLIESVAANEAVGQVYLYRLLVREAGTKAV